MNEFIKVVLVGCALVLAIVLNIMLFDVIFKPDFEYLKNIWWSVLFSIAATASQLALLRMAMGKLRVRLVWDSEIEDSGTKRAGSIAPIVFPFLILVVMFSGLIYWLTRPSEYELEKEYRIAAAGKLQDPWEKFQVLMRNRSPNALGLWPRPSDSDKAFSALAREMLEKALMARSQPAQDYACRTHLEYAVLDSLTEKYCPSIGLRNANELLILAREDAKHQGLPIPPDATIAELARKHGGKYVVTGWMFASIKDRDSFKRELVPARAVLSSVQYKQRSGPFREE